MEQVIERIADVIRDTAFAGNTYIAGGYVRDQILGNKNNDLDIAVSIPQGGIKLAKYLHEKKIASKPVIFKQFGTALAEIDNHKIEFVMTRNESYRYGSRKPSTNPGTLLEDIIRRDFTINSLVMDISSGEILDLTGKGIPDIRAGLIRATSDPEFIFNDDPLRILRAIRFANRLHFVIEAKTGVAMKKDSPELQNISWERRRDELEKILLSETPDQGIKLLYQYDLMQYLMPEINEKKKELYFTELKMMPVDLSLRLAALLHILSEQENWKEKISEIIERLRFSGKIRIIVNFLIDGCNLISAANINLETWLPLRSLVYKKNHYLDILLNYYEVFSEVNDWQYKQAELNAAITKIRADLYEKIFPLNGNIIKKEYNLPDCEEIGKIKNKALILWLQDPDLSASTLLKKLKKD